MSARSILLMEVFDLGDRQYEFIMAFKDEDGEKVALALAGLAESMRAYHVEGVVTRKPWVERTP